MPKKNDEEERRRKEKEAEEEKQKEVMRSQRDFLEKLSVQETEALLEGIDWIMMEMKPFVDLLDGHETQSYYYVDPKNKTPQRKLIEAILDQCIFYYNEIMLEGPDNIVIPSFVEYPALQRNIAIALAIRNLLDTMNTLILLRKNPDTDPITGKYISAFLDRIHYPLEYALTDEMHVQFYKHVMRKKAGLYITPYAIQERLHHIDYIKDVRAELLRHGKLKDEVNIICDYLFKLYDDPTYFYRLKEREDREAAEMSVSGTDALSDEKKSDNQVSVNKKNKPRTLTLLQEGVLSTIPAYEGFTEMKEGKPMSLAYQRIRSDIIQCTNPTPDELEKIIRDVHDHVRNPQNEYNRNELTEFETFMGVALRAIADERDRQNESIPEPSSLDELSFQPEDLESPPPLNIVLPLDEEKSPRGPGFFQPPDSAASSDSSNVELQQTIDKLRERKDSAGTPQLERDLLQRAINWGNEVLQGNRDINSIFGLRTTLERVKKSTGTREEKAGPLPESIETFLSTIESVNSAPRKKR